MTDQFRFYWSDISETEDIEEKHLAGRHDQDEHGRKGTGAVEYTQPQKNLLAVRAEILKLRGDLKKKKFSPSQFAYTLQQKHSFDPDGAFNIAERIFHVSLPSGSWYNGQLTRMLNKNTPFMELSPLLVKYLALGYLAKFEKFINEPEIKHLAGKHNQSTHGRPSSKDLPETRPIDISFDDPVGVKLVKELTTIYGGDTTSQATKIAEAANVPKEFAEDICKKWSEDVGLAAIFHLQCTASDLFGIVPSSHFIRTFVSDYNSKRDRTNEKNESKLLSSVYKGTQDWFEKQGIKEVILYRGMRQPIGDQVLQGPLDTDPLSSWSADPTNAASFGATVVSAVVPIERIISCAATGFGHPGEAEFVVLGGTLSVSARSAVSVLEEAMRRNRAKRSVKSLLPKFKEVTLAKHITPRGRNG